MHPAIKKYMVEFDELLTTGVPGIYKIWQEANRFFQNGNLEEAKKCEQLIYLLHNSIVYAECKLGNVHFAYGGIGTVIHKDAEILDGVMIGQGVTVGGNIGKFRIFNDKRLYIPKINEHVYIASGSKIIGGIEVGSYSIIGANTVVTKDIPPLSVVAGGPMKLINKITLDNCLSYKNMFPLFKKMTNEEFIEHMKEVIKKYD